MDDLVSALIVVTIFALFIFFPIISLIGVILIVGTCITINDRCRNYIKDKFMIIYEIIKKA